MGVTFVIGRAGTGKTRRCLDAISAELRSNSIRPSIFWLLPRQATFSAERQLACNTGLGGFCRARVLSFAELGREILDECGGSSIPQVTPLGRQMIISHLLHKHASELKFLKLVAMQPGLGARLDATFTEFEHEGKTVEDLASLYFRLSNDVAENANLALIDKVHDLHLIYERYGQYLGQDRLDQHRRLERVLRCIDTSRMFDSAIVFVDGFTEFTAYERSVLARLGKRCQRLEITLRMNPHSPLLRDPHQLPEELSLFHQVEATYRKLWFTFHMEQTPVDEPTVVLTENHRHQNQNLRELEKRLFDQAVVYVQQKSGEGIELLQATDRRAEVDAAARRIQQLLADSYRLRDIAVIVRDLSEYHDLIEPAFAEHNIPYFVDRRRATSHHPLPQWIRAVLMLAKEGWNRQWPMTMVKSGLAGISDSDADELENYVLRHRITGDTWTTLEPWSFEQPDIGTNETDQPAPLVFPIVNEVAHDSDEGKQDESEKVDRIRTILVTRLIPFFEFARTIHSLRQFAAALFDTMERFQIRTQLFNWMSSGGEDAEQIQLGEHEQVWNKLVEMLEEVVAVLGDEPVSLGGFHELIESCLEQFEFAITPPAVDQVLVGQADRTHPQGIRAVLVLGLNEGGFPRSATEDSVLSDRDRLELRSRELPVAPPSDRKLLDETLLAYQACTSASELLYASRVVGDDGGKTAAESVYFLKLRQMFPKAAYTRLDQGLRDDPQFIGTPRQLVTGLMRWARNAISDGKTLNQIAHETTPWPALYHWLAEYPCNDSRLDRTRFTAWKALSSVNRASLSKQLASRLFPSPLTADVRQLETYAACPFQHFTRYGLKLQSRPVGDEITGADVGRIYHRVLDDVLRSLLRMRQTFAHLKDDDRRSIVHGAALEIGQLLRNQVMQSTARNRYILKRIESIATRVVQTQSAVEQQGRFAPLLSQIRFGHGGVAGPTNLSTFTVQTRRGQTVQLRGTIDRVDGSEDGESFAAIDYRLGTASLRLDEVYHGLSLQLLTCLLVLQANSSVGKTMPSTPAAAFYVRLLRGLSDVDHPSDAISPDDPAFPLQTKPRGLIDERFVRDFDREINGTSKVIAATLTKAGTLGSKSRSDVASTDEFSAMLFHVERRLGELVDGILEGNVAIHPYLLRQQSPCPKCEFRSICRFEPAARGYRLLTPLGRELVLQRVLKEHTDGR